MSWEYQKLTITGKWSDVTVPSRPNTITGANGLIYIKGASGSLEGPIRGLREVNPEVQEEPPISQETIDPIHAAMGDGDLPPFARPGGLDDTTPVATGDATFSAGTWVSHKDMLYAAATLLADAEGRGELRQGLKETPKRFADAWRFYMSGYDIEAADILKTFEDGAENYDEMVMVKNIPFYSHCEHHLAPIFGRVTVGYIPDKRIVGLSKINRLVDIYARRLQVQERLTTQIATAINDHLRPAGVGVLVEARHMCMEARGVCQQGHTTITSALRGAMHEGAARAEFMALAR